MRGELAVHRSAQLVHRGAHRAELRGVRGELAVHRNAKLAEACLMLSPSLDAIGNPIAIGLLRDDLASLLHDEGLKLGGVTRVLLRQYVQKCNR